VDGPNLYVYVSDNPVRKVDPSGTQGICESDPDPLQDWIDPMGTSEMPEEGWDYGADDGPILDEETEWAGAEDVSVAEWGGLVGDVGIEDYSGPEEPLLSEEEEFGGDAPDLVEGTKTGPNLVEKIQAAWEQGSTSDKVVMGATATGTAGSAIPYAGDYIALLGSIVSFGAQPSLSNAGDVGLDVVGALFPLVPALGTMRKMEKIADAGEAAHDLEKAVDAVDAAQSATRGGVARPGELYGRQGPREFTGSQIKRLKKSMKTSGYDPSKPIDIVEVNGRKIIIQGHHRARAAGAAKIKEVPVRIHDVDAATAARLEQEAARAAHELGLSHRW
jgi:hypothetical protein